MAARIIGFVGYSNENQFAGQSGLERYYEDVLARNNNSLNVNFLLKYFQI